MNRDRQFDHVLETWLLDGASEMPDRLFDAVLDRIETVPQRRIARLKLRFRDMTPMLKIAAATALVIVIAVAGVALIGRPSDRSVGVAPTSSPSAIATASPTATPTPAPTLEGDWRACPTKEQILAAGGGEKEATGNAGCSVLSFHEGVFTEKGTSALTTQFGSYVVEGDQVRIRRANSEVFLYAWLATPDTLTFSKVPGSGVSSPAPWRAIPFHRTTV